VACNRNAEGVALFRSAATVGVYALWKEPESNQCTPKNSSTPPKSNHKIMYNNNNDGQSNPRYCLPLSAQGGNTGWVLDLHGCSTSVASVAFQVALQCRLHFYMTATASPKTVSLLPQNDAMSGHSGCFDDLVVIVGQGIHSQQQHQTVGSPLSTYMIHFMTRVLEECAPPNKLAPSYTSNVTMVPEGDGGQVSTSDDDDNKQTNKHCAVRIMPTNPGRLIVSGDAIEKWVHCQLAKKK
jgi:hypothetical protein